LVTQMATPMITVCQLQFLHFLCRPWSPMLVASIAFSSSSVC
jgi:hypothetical protein